MHIEKYRTKVLTWIHCRSCVRENICSGTFWNVDIFQTLIENFEEAGVSPRTTSPYTVSELFFINIANTVK